MPQLVEQDDVISYEERCYATRSFIVKNAYDLACGAGIVCASSAHKELPYILAYKPTLKLPQNEEFCKSSYLSRPPKKSQRVMIRRLKKQIGGAQSKHNLFNQTWLYCILFEVQLKLRLKLCCSLSELTLFSAVSIFMAACMTEDWMVISVILRDLRSGVMSSRLCEIRFMRV